MSVLTLQMSMLFDIRLGGDFDGQITYFQPVLAPLPLEQAVFEAGKPCSELIGHFFFKDNNTFLLYNCPYGWVGKFVDLMLIVLSLFLCGFIF